MSTAIFAELAETVGEALLKCAASLRESTDDRLTVEPSIDPAVELPLGARQREMVDVLRSAGERGLTTSRICELMDGYDTANGHVALRSLETRRVVEEVPGERPIRWRLAAPYRATADPYLAVASRVKPGEWTTYGDISVAVREDTKAARAIGRAASMLEHFPNPHRVIQSGGRIPDGWKPHDSDAPNPGECRRLLEAEGVKFDERGRAKRKQYVAWDVLRERRDDGSPLSVRA